MVPRTTITLASIVDNHLAIMQGALLQSIQDHYKSDEKIDYYLITDNLSEINKKKLCFNIHKINLIWVDINDVIPDNINLPVDKSSFPINVYARLFIPNIIAENTERTIYLDVDMVVMEDISKLWKIDMADYPVGGVLDRSRSVSCEWAGISNYKELGLAKDTGYYNTGMFIMNNRRWKAENYAQRIVDCLQENIKFSSFPINYGMNVILANQWLTLDARWNAYAMEEINEPFIIHFAGKKPIFKSYSYNQEYKTIFFKYIEKTAWKGFQPIGERRRLVKKLYNKIEKRIQHLLK
ncbi:glycosyltransferase family 8 protein [Parapedobacter sp. 10938]|uniref:glycosyltransferase family 8 protein n=1 Tax=Parapedobacter flavus TaxID=3110225 RepID=UPI002DB5D946|nr:glycosyltransferase [Parapedobacter sp. 10938]MEC3879888.1 glycosyltransferase [Parapedobacter sp. 10938]